MQAARASGVRDACFGEKKSGCEHDTKLKFCGKKWRPDERQEVTVRQGKMREVAAAVPNGALVFTRHAWKLFNCAASQQQRLQHSRRTFRFAKSYEFRSM